LLRRPAVISVPSSPLDTPGFEIHRIGHGGYRLQLWGRLRPGWCGSLAEGLAGEGISLTSGFARKIGAMRWLAEFDLSQPPRATNPLVLDYLDIAGRELPAGSTRPVRLADYRLVRSRKHGGSLTLDVMGEDAVGFLGALLMRLAALSLFPEELHLESNDGRVHDRFHLVGIGRTEPSEQTAAALEELLSSLRSGAVE
jgi:hypothetical protein